MSAVEREVGPELVDAELLTSDGSRLYLNEIRKQRLLTRAEEVELAQKKDRYLRRGDDVTPRERLEGKRAFEDMVCANLRLVVFIAKRYQSSTSLPLVDLCQEGVLGLHRAIEKFDWRMGCKLSTYATWWIRQSITRAIAEHGRGVRIPVHRVEQLNRYRRCHGALEARLGREPTLRELATELELHEEEVEDLRLLSREPVSLNGRIGDGDQVELCELVPDETAPEPETVVLRDEPTQVLRRALGQLSALERKVIEFRHGIGQEAARTLEEVAVKLGVTRERVRQYEQDAWRKLRANRELAELATALE
jgi:RNA polymerase primary sigma factor